MALDYLTVLTLVIGNGALIAIITLLFNYYSSKQERSHEARKEAKEYYMKLYSHIAYIDELLSAYMKTQHRYWRRAPQGLRKVFTRENGFTALTPDQILNHFEKAYEDFLSYYIEKRCEGYDIYVSKKLWRLLGNLRLAFEMCYKKSTQSTHEESLKIDPQDLWEVQKIALKIREHMEKLFGLK